MIKYTCKKFEDLTVNELYGMMQLRQEVFILEQNCPYLDADGKDISGYHVMGTDEAGTIHCCTRLLPEGISYPGYISIGRVANSLSVRGSGEGKKLMLYSINRIIALFPGYPIKIGAQAYLNKFYASLGFKDNNISYLEDGIPHIIMTMDTTLK